MLLILLFPGQKEQDITMGMDINYFDQAGRRKINMITTTITNINDHKETCKQPLKVIQASYPSPFLNM